MLVLQRRPGEAILIDRVTRVEVVSVKGDKVKLAFTAPKDVSIFRTEVLDDSKELARPQGSDG
jgi:carbon storage regulator